MPPGCEPSSSTMGRLRLTRRGSFLVTASTARAFQIAETNQWRPAREDFWGRVHKEGLKEGLNWRDTKYGDRNK